MSLHRQTDTENTRNSFVDSLTSHHSDETPSLTTICTRPLSRGSAAGEQRKVVQHKKCNVFDSLLAQAEAGGKEGERFPSLFKVQAIAATARSEHEVLTRFVVADRFYTLLPRRGGLSSVCCTWCGRSSTVVLRVCRCHCFCCMLLFPLVLYENTRRRDISKRAGHIDAHAFYCCCWLDLLRCSCG
jgi:hypothetical protein